MIRKTFYLMDIENDNGKLRWSWTGFNDWNPIHDLDCFLEIYFPPPWWGRVRTELGLTLPTEKITIDAAIEFLARLRDMRPSERADVCYTDLGQEVKDALALGIEALKRVKAQRGPGGEIGALGLPGETE